MIPRRLRYIRRIFKGFPYSGTGHRVMTLTRRGGTTPRRRANSEVSLSTLCLSSCDQSFRECGCSRGDRFEMEHGGQFLKFTVGSPCRVEWDALESSERSDRPDRAC